MEISEPVTLAKFPRSLGTGRAQTHFAPVYAWTGNTRRRRPEICVAIDGDSLSIIDARNGRPVLSHPVPPDVTFEQTPQSYYTKQEKAYTRRTCCIVKRRDVVLVQSWTNANVDNPIEERVLSQSLPHSDRRPIDLHVQRHGDLDPALVVYEDGQIVLLDIGSPQPIRKHQLSMPNGPPDFRILTSQWLTSTEARRTVLKSRPDLANHIGERMTCLIGLATSRADDSSANHQYCMWLLDAEADRHKTLSSISITEPIFVHSIGDATKEVSSKPTASFSHCGDSLTLLDAAKVVSFDLTGITPLRSSTIHLADPSASSLKLSTSCALMATSHSLEIHHVKYGTIQASRVLKKPTLKRKRPRSTAVQGGSLKLLMHFPRSHRVLGHRGNQLVAIDVKIPSQGSGGKLSLQADLLIGNIGKGLTRKPLKSTEPPVSTASSQDIDRWRTAEQEMDEAALTKNGKLFDDVFEREVAASGSFFDTSPQFVDLKTDFILSKLLTIEPRTDAEDGTTNQLRFNFIAQATVVWMLKQDLFSKRIVERACGSRARSQQRCSLESDAIARAFFTADEDLHVLATYMLQSPRLNTSELCFVVQALIRQAVDDEEPVDGSMALVNGDTAANTGQVESKNVSSLGPRITRCLNIALRRLASMGTTQVVGAFSSKLESTDVLTLLQFLRHQLFISGYTRAIQHSSYQTPPASDHGSPEPPSATSSYRALSLHDISVLLCSCLDAIGPIGMLGAPEHDEFIEAVIPELRSEVAHAVEAVEDDVYLRGLLREMQRYSYSVQRSGGTLSHKTRSPDRPFRLGDVEVLFEESGPDGNGVDASAALPLSLKSDAIDPLKIRKGDGTVSWRTSRELGMLVDRRRASYAFERVHL